MGRRSSLLENDLPGPVIYLETALVDQVELGRIQVFKNRGFTVAVPTVRCILGFSYHPVYQ